jgi:hypothetical protein
MPTPVSIFSHRLGVVLGDTARRAPAVAEKTNEITASARAYAFSQMGEARDRKTLHWYDFRV